MTAATTHALALHGGAPVRTTPFPPAPGVGEAEARAVAEVMASGSLSAFIAVWGEDFGGGPRVRALERAWAERFGVRHATSMNSATSALNAATAAAGVGPGDEVIVSPYTMTASAVCALVHGAIPVFADIEPDTFCLDPESVRACITPRTKAIVAVNIFGCPADFDALMAIARDHDLVVIEDAAQAPGALRGGRPAGTLGHIGVFSLNYHKTIQCGEGGVAVTDDDALAERLALARNHGEAVVAAMGSTATDVLGFNYRMGELEAAIAEVQLGRLDELTAPRIAHAERLTEALSGLEGITPPHVPDDVRHVYYLHVIKVDEQALGIPRSRFAAALAAEGVPVTEGYVSPLYRQPLYRDRAAAAFGDPRNAGLGSYADGTAPTCERMHEHEVLYHPHIHAGLSAGDVDDVAAAFRKVHARRGELAR
jgi:dTDP-4-amino-4,6-dideoxygalactose transaminase